MHYFTFDDAGQITGAFIQELQPEHEAGNFMEVSEEQFLQRANLMIADGVLVERPPQAPEVVLAAAQAQAWEAIKALRDHLSDRGGYSVVVGGVAKWFHSDAKSKIQQLGLVIAGAGVPAVQWKTMDGTFVTMSQALAGQIFQAAAAQDVAIFAVAEVHRLAMLQAEDPLAYDHSTGWPAVYGES